MKVPRCFQWNASLDPNPSAKVILKSAIGARRILDMPTGEQIPRICLWILLLSMISLRSAGL